DRGRPRFGGPCPTRGAAGCYLREEGRPGCTVQADELFHPGRGNLHVFVFFQCYIDELIQDGVVKLLPPGRVGHVLSFLFAKTPLLGAFDRRALVVRAEHAAGKDNC
ncbi:MAG: hypothetical protein ACXWMO_06200, partial [Syntrophales bacterium]